MLNLNLNT